MPGVVPPDMEPEPAPPSLPLPVYGFTVSHQKLDLEVDFARQTLTGYTEITILPQDRNLRAINIDARQCVIPVDGVMINGKCTRFSHEDYMQKLEIPAFLQSPEQYGMQLDRIMPLTNGRATEGGLAITVPDEIRIEGTNLFLSNATPAATPRPLGLSGRSSSFALDGSGPPSSATLAFTPKTAAAEQSTQYQPLIVRISFTASNFREGLHFVGLDGVDERYPHVYTRHSIDTGIACCIFPCVDDPSMRCTWELNIKCARTLGDALKRSPLTHGYKGAHHVNGKRGLTNGHVNDIVEDFVVPLNDEDKSLELTVVCSGEFNTETIDLDDSSKKNVSFTCSTVVAPQHIGFAIGPFEQVDLAEFRDAEDDEKLRQEVVPISAYCLPLRVNQVRHTCSPLANALDWFQPTFGSYPFPDHKLVFVDDQLHDIEHTASLSLCSNRLLFSEDIIDPETEIARTLVHAIASQWFGVSIVPNQRVDSWVTIGISHFMTDLYMKTICGYNWYAFRQKTLSDKLVELDAERPPLHALGEVLYFGNFEMEFMALKAPLVLFILDRRIIKASGSAGLTRVISRITATASTGTSNDSMVSTEGFRKLVEKVTKYRQTEPFWNQWILNAGCPRFHIIQRFNKKRLCVEMTISQTQQLRETSPPKNLERGSFRREFKEHVKFVWAGPIQPVFTGPMTIRIHEADGTPYEHIVELRDGITKIDIPYNTKYKRLKRTRRQKEKMNAGPVDASAEAGEDALYYCLGDVLQSENDEKEWGLSDWGPESQQLMEQESYEWIRVDADFEWLCAKDFISMPSYMWVSQLQQDRDVVAQQESLILLKSHPESQDGNRLVSTFLIRTLMDTRYYHGIRTMAAAILKMHAVAKTQWVGMTQLEKAYQEFFCIPGTRTPRPNDFSDKKAYHVEMAIAKSLSTIRDSYGKCPKHARNILMDMLELNDNSSNQYSDDHKIANLLSCLTESLIVHTDKDNVLEKEGNQEAIGAMKAGEAMEDLENLESLENVEKEELEVFKKKVITNLDRYQRRDAWMDSYQNIFTVTALDCKQRLMKGNVIPTDPVEFAQFLNDGNSEPVRIKAFEALMNLGYLRQKNLAGLLLSSLSTDRSPHTRDQLFGVFCLGLADIAFGDLKAPVLASAISASALATAPHLGENGEMHLDGEADGGLIIETEASAAPRKVQNDRTTTMVGALAALKEELKDDRDFKAAVWKAIESPVIGIHEQSDLLDICFTLCERVCSLIVRLKLPRYWKVTHLGKGRLIFQKTSKLRTKPFKPVVPKPPVSTINVEPSRVLPLPRALLPPKPLPLPRALPIPRALPTAQPPRPSPQVRISFSGSHTHSTPTPTTPRESTGTMKAPRPPKRPLTQEKNMRSEERPRKIIKLKVDPRKVQAIERIPPHPALVRTKPTTKSSSPALRPSPAPRPSTSVIPARPSLPNATLSQASPTTVTPPSDGRPGNGAPQPKIRKPLPTSAPRPPPESNTTPAAPRKFVLKLKTGGAVMK